MKKLLLLILLISFNTSAYTTVLLSQEGKSSIAPFIMQSYNLDRKESTFFKFGILYLNKNGLGMSGFYNDYNNDNGFSISYDKCYSNINFTIGTDYWKISFYEKYVNLIYIGIGYIERLNKNLSISIKANRGQILEDKWDFLDTYFRLTYTLNNNFDITTSYRLLFQEDWTYPTVSLGLKYHFIINK